jgi:hypothetical protein
MARQYRHVCPATRRLPPETARYRLVVAVATAIASAWAAHGGWLGDAVALPNITLSSDPYELAVEEAQALNTDG